jgi:hypothetical protein
MVTKHQIDRLSQRIDEVAERLGMAQPIQYTVFLRWIGEDDAAFYQRNPTAPLDPREMLHISKILSFLPYTFRQLSEHA